MAPSVAGMVIEPVPGSGTDVALTLSCWSQPPARPRYQPSPAIAGVLRAAAATVAMASIRSFMFLPSLENLDGQVPPPIRVNQCSAYNGASRKSLHHKCCFAADFAPLSKVLPPGCDTVATAKANTLQWYICRLRRCAAGRGA